MELIELLTRLKDSPSMQPAVLSGRRLEHILRLVPVHGILLAGTYGIELRLPGGGRENRLVFSQIRPALDKLKPHWERLISGGNGFYLEDKGWTLAIHARFVDDKDAETVIQAARVLAERSLDGRVFRIIGGHKFLEAGPLLANKGSALEYFLERFPAGDAELVYVGDDDKDEEAFKVVNQHGGTAIVVSREPRQSYAALRLENPQDVRKWLESLTS